MPKTSALTNEPLEIAIAVEQMAQTILSLGEWLLKQKQQLKQQQRKLAEKKADRRTTTRDRTAKRSIIQTEKP